MQHEEPVAPQINFLLSIREDVQVDDFDIGDCTRRCQQFHIQRKDVKALP